MSLRVIQSSEKALASACAREALRDGIRRCGASVLLVPSFAQALDAQRALASTRDLALSVTTTTPSAWLGERWEVWGDGRPIADAAALMVLARTAIRQASPAELGPIELSPGVAQVLAQLVDRALPWLPLDEAGHARADVCADAGLTAAETLLIGLAGSLAGQLEAHGYVSAAEAATRVPAILSSAGARMPHVVLAGFSRMERRDRALVQALGELTDATLVVFANDGPASEQARRFAASFGLPVTRSEGREAPVDPRTPGLRALSEALFADRPLSPGNDSPVHLLLPAGPVAEAELVARHVERLLAALGETPSAPSARVVVAVPDVARARRELVPKLAARGITSRTHVSQSLHDRAATQAFLSYARAVAQLVALDATWPAPVEGPEGPVARLGDMGWWPPRELVDFLLSGLSHMPAERVWRLDAAWRGNRLLTPARVLEALQSRRDVSEPVARATTELLRGRVGSAAARLLAPLVGRVGEGSRDAAGPADQADQADAEAIAALQALIQLTGTLRELGVTAKPSTDGALTLSELVETCAWASLGRRVTVRLEAGPPAPTPQVSIMGLREAATLPCGSADALVLCGLTTAEQPVQAPDDLLPALLERLGIDPQADPMAEARQAFASLVAVPRSHLVLERALHDADAKPTYPSIMLSELLAAYDIPATAKPGAIALPHTLRGETALLENLEPDGAAPQPARSCDPAPAGRLTSASKGLVFVPQEGSDHLPGNRPLLSASQVETYLECPYKWFSLRRLRLGSVDAGHTGMEMGTFAHRVLEVTHRELLAQALEAEAPGVPREMLLASLAHDPACHVAGSRVGEGNLEEARALLDLEFERHRQHMHMVRRPRLAQQLLVAHDSFDRAQEDRLRQDLLSSLGYQVRILQGFEPRLFEWDFGRHGRLVEYAGAYFTGTVDRIDVSPHGTAVIIDYKHKSPVGFTGEYDALQDGVVEGKRLPNRVQSLIYAQVARRAFAGRLRLVGTVYLSTKSPHALAGAADEEVADLVFGGLRPARMPSVCVPRTPAGAPGMATLLDRTEELVAEQVAQMLSGNIEARPRDRRSCDFCPVMQCERRVAR